MQSTNERQSNSLLWKILTVLLGAGIIWWVFFRPVTIDCYSSPSMARWTEMRVELFLLDEALTAYQAVHGSFPETLDELLEPVDFIPEYVIRTTTPLHDPWGRPYMYGGE